MYEIDSTKFGERLKECIKSAGITQKDLALKINVSKTSINNYVGGRIPDAVILYKISKILNTTIEWLLAGEHPINQVVSFNQEEIELLNLYSSCNEIQQKDIVENIKTYLSNPDYNIIRSSDLFDDDEEKLISLFRRLTTREKIKIEGIIESKIKDQEDNKKGSLSTYPNGEEAATREVKYA